MRQPVLTVAWMSLLFAPLCAATVPDLERCVATLRPTLVRPWSFQPVEGKTVASGPSIGGEHLESVRLGIGLTSDPSTFLMAGELSMPLNRDWMFGPLLQIGVDDESFLLAPAMNVTYPFSPDGWSRLTPSIHGGAGFLYLNEEGPGNSTDRDDIGPLIGFGFGLDYRVSSSLAIGSHVRFNILPVEVIDENFFISWELIHLRFLM